MNHEQEQDEKIQKLQEQNKKMKKRLLIVGGAVVAVILLLVALIAILQACDAANASDGELPEEYFHPAHQGDIFAYPAYLDKSPEVIMYCASPNGMGRITQIDRETPDTYPETVIYLYDFLQIMMHGDVEAYNDCFNQAYYKKHQPKTAFSQQMIYQAEIRFLEEAEYQGDRMWTYELRYKLYENDGSLRRDVGSDAIVPLYVTLRVTPDGEIAIEDLYSARKS